MTFPERLRLALTSDAAAAEPLAIFRIGIAAVALLQAIVLWAYRDLLLAEFGLVPWIISDPMTDPWFFKLSHVAALLAPLGIGADGAVAMLIAVHAAAAAALLVGWRTRTAAIVTWLTFLPLKHTGFLFTYGLGSLLLIGLFYCVLMPVGRAWAVHRSPPSGANDDEWVSFSVIVLRIHLCIVYAAAGVSKAMGEQWWTGDAVWRALSLPQFQQFDPAPLLAYTPLLQATAVASVLIQITYPVLVWTRLRALAVFLTELLHLGIAIALGLWLFSLVMIVFNAGAFGQSLWRAIPARLRLPPRPAEGSTMKLRIVYDGACPFCDDYVRYQRLDRAAGSLELVDARAHPEVLAQESISHEALEDGMVVIADGRQHHGADAVHLLSLLSESPDRWWVRMVAAVSRSGPVAHALYPLLKLGRRVALAALGIPRFPRG